MQIPQGDSWASPSHPFHSSMHITSTHSTTDPMSQDNPLLTLPVAELCEIKYQVQELQQRAPMVPPGDVQGSPWTHSHALNAQSLSTTAKRRRIILKSSSLAAEHQPLSSTSSGPSLGVPTLVIPTSAADWEQRRLHVVASFRQDAKSHSRPHSLASKRRQVESSSSALSGHSVPSPATPTLDPEPVSAQLETLVPPLQSPPLQLTCLLLPRLHLLAQHRLWSLPPGTSIQRMAN